MAWDIYGGRETTIDNGIVKDHTTKQYGIIDGNYGRSVHGTPEYEICGNSIRRYGSTMEIAHIDGNMVKCSDFNHSRYSYGEVIGYADNHQDALSLIMKNY